MTPNDGKDGEATGPGREPESLLDELPPPGGRGAGSLTWWAPSPRAKLLLLLTLLAAACSVTVAKLAINAFGATSGPLGWSAPALVDHQYPYSIPAAITGLSCVSESLCVGDAGSQILTSTDPAGSSPSDWSVASTSLLTEGATGYSLDGASCVTVGASPFCATAGVNPVDSAEPGVILTSTEPAGGLGSWQTASLASSFLSAPSCVQGGVGAPETLCVTAGAAESGKSPTLYASSDPGGGASKWTAIPITLLDEAQLKAPSCPSTGLCLAVASNGEAYISTDPTSKTSWQATLNTTGLQTVVSLSCPTTGFCLAFGENSDGSVSASTMNPSGTEPRWTNFSPTGVGLIDAGIGGVSCFPDSEVSSPPNVLCLAGAAGEPFGDPGGVEISTDEGHEWTAKSLSSYTGFPSVFSCVGGSGSLCLTGTETGAVLNSSDAARGASSTWSEPVGASPGSSPLERLACSSPSFCVGIDSAGNVLTSTDPSGGAAGWSAPVNIDYPLNYLISVACAPPSGSLCVAIDASGDILTSTDPAGGAKAWSNAKSSDTSGPRSVACPSDSLCLISDEDGNILYSTDPAGGVSTWSAPESVDTDGIESIACVPSSTLCFLVDGGGNVLYSTNPSGGLSSWSAPAKIDTDPLESLACPSASLCVASDSSGDVLYSTNPTGGPSAWSAPESVDKLGLRSVTCAPSTTTCVAEDYLGELLYSANPSGGLSSWSAPASVDTSVIESVTCPSASLCLAGDILGNVLAGTTLESKGGESTGGTTSTSTAPPTFAAGSSPVVLTTSSATFTATVNPEGLETEVHFEYGPVLPGASAAAVTYESSTPDQSVGSDFADHTVTATVTGLLPNVTYNVRAVATNSAGTSLGANQTLVTPADPPPPPPVLGKSANVKPVSGIVYIELPAGAKLASLSPSSPFSPFSLAASVPAPLTKGLEFVPLTEARQIPVGSTLDTAGGVVNITTATTSSMKGKVQTGDFGAGLFKLLQGRKQRGLTELDIIDSHSPHQVCASIGKRAQTASKHLSSTVLGRLNSSDHGKFTTRGQYSASTVRGTVYSVINECRGTLTEVSRGLVSVRDFSRRKTITLHTGQHYLAKAPL